MVCVDAARRSSPPRDAGPATAAERGPPADDARLHHLHVGIHRAAQGRGRSSTPSICNFVRVAAEVYGIRPDDRMYQGMTIAFDFSVEEIWVPWMAGATLVPEAARVEPARRRAARVPHRAGGSRRCAACPRCWRPSRTTCPTCGSCSSPARRARTTSIVRWHRPGRRFLNVYGPTEATVTATWTAVDPDRAVTIGVPLPTYSVVILDPDDPTRALSRGEIGEIGIAGIGLAVGYVNRPTTSPSRAFIRGLPRHPEQPLRPDLPHRRPGPDQRDRGDRVPRPDRPAGEDPRLPHRAHRDRVGAAAGARRRPGRGGHLRAGARHARAGGLLQPADRQPSTPERKRSARCCASGSRRTWCRRTSSTSTSSR